MFSPSLECGSHSRHAGKRPSEQFADFFLQTISLFQDYPNVMHLSMLGPRKGEGGQSGGDFDIFIIIGQNPHPVASEGGQMFFV